MSSSLRAKLAAIGHGEKRAAPRRSAGPEERKVVVPLPDGLRAPDAVALRRMGLEGEWPGIERVVFLDTETTGLAGGAGTLAFMLGMAYTEDDTFVFHQITLNDYADEPSMLLTLSRVLRDRPLVISFNGRTFDVPLLRSRFTMARMDGLWCEPTQLDLLGSARRLWKKRLGSVKLSLLEEKVLRKGRQDDLPGSEAPKRFFTYLKTGDHSLLAPVAEHNMQDVLSMPRLMLELLDAYAEPRQSRPSEDLISLGKVLEKQGERQEAVRCYHMASLPRPVTCVSDLGHRRVVGEALYAMGLLYKRLGQYERAASAFEGVAQRAQMGILPMVELAKHFEHREKDMPKALYWTRRALALKTDEAQREELLKRAARIERKMKLGGK